MSRKKQDKLLTVAVESSGHQVDTLRSWQIVTCRRELISSLRKSQKCICKYCIKIFFFICSRMRDEQILPLSEQEIAAEVKPLNGESTISFSDDSTFQSRRKVCFWTRPDQNAVQAKAFKFKRKTPLPGAYPLHYSPYRLAKSSSANNSVSLTPAEIYSDCKEICEGARTEFSSKYFVEDGDGVDSVATPVEDCSDSKKNVVNSFKRNSAPRYSGRRVLSSVQLAMPKTIQEERRQIRAAMKASVESAASASKI